MLGHHAEFGRSPTSRPDVWSTHRPWSALHSGPCRPSLPVAAEAIRASVQSHFPSRATSLASFSASFSRILRPSRHPNSQIGEP